jgi:tRNA (uracil-5-)-methyltransferase TRM9
LGVDYSRRLLQLSHDMHPHSDLIQSDVIQLPLKAHCVDYAICIAVIHHFASWERRRTAVMDLIRIVRPGGRILIFVWALEQRPQSKRQFDCQDVLVPWKARDQTIYQRYYHVFKQGELEQLVQDAASYMNVDIKLCQSGYDRDNWYCEFQTI